MKKVIITLICACTCLAQANPELEKRITDLETELAELKTVLAPVLEKAKLEQQVAEQRKKAQERMSEDSKIFSRDEMIAIEKLYQKANQKWETPEGKESLEELIATYDNANRTGCALLYLGQLSEGEEREEYLKRAIEGYSDCYYGSGVQVGAYARFLLGLYYKTQLKLDEADALFDEIVEMYPDAIDHRGTPLSDLIVQSYKEMPLPRVESGE